MMVENVMDVNDTYTTSLDCSMCISVRGGAAQHLGCVVYYVCVNVISSM